jgi:DNA-binding CsgD family transcriptional regulator/tetratricopeptide (TPR) repeat protein
MQSSFFVERAAAVQPGFALTAENAMAVARICRQLDGLPLAIELAAGRVPILFPGGIAARLDDSLQLLTRGSRAALPRQQTLRATLDWSYSLLTPAERTLFRRTSVFASGWTLSAAEMVCGGDGVHVLDRLSRLVDKSLVIVEEHNGEGRFRLLETMRQYAAEKLHAAGEADNVQRRHFDWCMGLAARFDAEWRGPDQVSWFACLEQEHDNLRAALAWRRAASADGDAEAGLRLAGAMWHFWEVRGYFSEGRSWLAGLLAMPTATPVTATPARAKALDGAGHLALLQGNQAAGMPLLQESLAAWRSLGDKRGIAQVLHSLGLAAQYQGDPASATLRHRESLALARAVDDRVGIHLAIYNLAVVAQANGDYERAVALHEESLVLKRAQNDPWSIAFSLQNLGLLAWRQDQAERAVALLQQSLRLRWALRGEVGIAMCLETLAEIAASRGQARRAARLLGSAHAELESSGVTLMALLCTRYPGTQLPGDGQAGTVVRASLGTEEFAIAWAEGQAMLTDQAVEYALSGDASSEPVAPLSVPVGVAPGLLTRRERDVAELVGQGLTNRQIAAELVISPWTASTHVRNILAKLGVARRAQLAAWTVAHRR